MDFGGGADSDDSDAEDMPDLETGIVCFRSLASIGDPVACYLRREPQRRQTSVQRKPGNTYAHAQDDCSFRMQFDRCRSLWHRFEPRSTRAHCAQAMTQSNVLRKAASTPLRAR
jgi:hypothetical protein